MRGVAPCSVYVSALDVAVLTLTIGDTIVTVASSDLSLQSNWQKLPGVHTPWYDGSAKLYGATLSTSGLKLPGVQFDCEAVKALVESEAVRCWQVSKSIVSALSMCCIAML